MRDNSDNGNGNETNPMYTCTCCEIKAGARCGGCLIVAYCSKECQLKDWKAGHKNDCIGLEVKRSENDKRAHLYVTKVFEAGSVIGKETPLATAPINTLIHEKYSQKGNNNVRVLCIVCCKILLPNEVKPCVNCSMNMCGAPACVKDKTHAAVECPIRKWQKNRRVTWMYIVPTDYVFLLRIMHLKKSNSAAWTKLLSLNPNLDRVHLEQHSTLHNDVSADLILYLNQTAGSLERNVQNYLERLGGVTNHYFNDAGADESCVKELDQVLDIMDANSLDDESADYEDTWSTHMKWIGYYSGTAAHSCLPNVTWKINSKRQVVYRAITSLKAGDEVFMSKDPADLALYTEKRRGILRDQKGFLCKCPRCTDPTELGSYFSALKCLEPNCTGYSLMVDPLLPLSGIGWMCDTCQNVIPSEAVPDVYASVSRRCIQLVAELRESSDLPVFVDKMQKMIKECEKCAHPNHGVFRCVREKLVRTIFKPIVLCLQGLEIGLGLRPHDSGWSRIEARKHLIQFAKLIITESKYALDESNPSTTGYTRLRGHTLAKCQVALAFLFRYGSEQDVEEVGLDKARLYELEREAIQILEFYAKEIIHDSNLIRLMCAAQFRIPVEPEFADVVKDLRDLSLKALE